MAPFHDGSTARVFHVSRDGQTCYENIFLHPSGALYGGSGMGCWRWWMEAGQLYFFDVIWRVRYIFEPVAADRWVCRARERSPDMRIRPYTLQLKAWGPATVAMSGVASELVAEVLPGRERLEIVVAKYREDVAWAEALGRAVTIYSKHAEDAGKYPVLANRGREGGTYLHHIVTRYDDLAERTLFLQGDPFPHPLLSFGKYANDTAPMTTARCAESPMDEVLPWSTAQQPIDAAAKVAFLRLVECPWQMERFHWVQGAQFALSREQIRRRPRGYYQRLLAITQEEWLELGGRRFDNHHVAWIFELFWRHIFLDEGA